jgi:class 3 adenylate cyclase
VTDVLEQRLAALDAPVRQLLEPWLRDDDEAALFRACPAEWGAARGLDLDVAIDALLRATRAGLVRMRWELICPQCFRLFDFVDSLTTIKDHGFCQLCKVETHVGLDDWIHVTFTVRPEVRAIRFHEPARLSGIERGAYCDTARGVRFSDGTPMYRHLARAMAMHDELAPGERREVTVPAESAMMLMVVPRTMVPLRGPASDHPKLAVTIRDGAVELSPPVVAPGAIDVTVTNASTKPQLCSVTWAGMAQLGGPPQRSGCPATLVIHHPTYAELFPSQLACAGGIAIRDVTVLFSDLYGSTAMYRDLGDLRAYERVRETFAEAGRVIAAHHGLWIKDMGDAVMASFAEPEAAVEAGVEMIEAVRAATGLQLKVGVHCGACIAVSFRDRLDWFGSTVNLAARIQSLAGPGELCLSDAAYQRSPRARALATDAPFSSRVRGVDEPVLAYRIAIRDA